MEKKRVRYILGGLIMALVLLALVWAFRPRSFADFSNMGQATDLYVYTADAGAGYELREARLSREEMGPLLDLLAGASIRLDGRSRVIDVWPSEGQALYCLYFGHVEEDHGVSDARFDLRSDGMLYTPLYIGSVSLGYARYQLSACDMDAVHAELQRLLGMAGTFRE